jgi:hypothetical protein
MWQYDGLGDGSVLLIDPTHEDAGGVAFERKTKGRDASSPDGGVVEEDEEGGQEGDVETVDEDEEERRRQARLATATGAAGRDGSPESSPLPPVRVDYHEMAANLVAAHSIALAGRPDPVDAAEGPAGAPTPAPSPASSIGQAPSLPATSTELPSDAAGTGGGGASTAERGLLERALAEAALRTILERPTPPQTQTPASAAAAFPGGAAGMGMGGGGGAGRHAAALRKLQRLFDSNIGPSFAGTAAATARADARRAAAAAAAAEEEEAEAGALGADALPEELIEEAPEDLDDSSVFVRVRDPSTGAAVTYAIPAALARGLPLQQLSHDVLSALAGQSSMTKPIARRIQGAKRAGQSLVTRARGDVVEFQHPHADAARHRHLPRPTRVFRSVYIAEVGRFRFRLLHRLEGRWTGEAELHMAHPLGGPAALPSPMHAAAADIRICTVNLAFDDATGVWKETQSLTSRDGLSSTQALVFRPVADGVCAVELFDPAEEQPGAHGAAGAAGTGRQRTRSGSMGAPPSSGSPAGGPSPSDYRMSLTELSEDILVLTAYSSQGAPILVETVTLIDDRRRCRTVQRFDDHGNFQCVYSITEERVIDAVTGGLVPAHAPAAVPATGLHSSASAPAMQMPMQMSSSNFRPVPGQILFQRPMPAYAGGMAMGGGGGGGYGYTFIPGGGSMGMGAPAARRVAAAPAPPVPAAHDYSPATAARVDAFRQQRASAREARQRRMEEDVINLIDALTLQQRQQATPSDAADEDVPLHIRRRPRVLRVIPFFQ